MPTPEPESVASPFLHEFTTVKMLIFMETTPLSDKFEQVALTREVLHKTLDTIRLNLPHNRGAFIVTTNHDVKVSVPNARDFYSKEEIKSFSNSEVVL
jgi:hypothetical protein